MKTLAVVMATAGLAVMLVSGCAKTPATTTVASVPTPEGRVTASPVERRVDTVAARPSQSTGFTPSPNATSPSATSPNATSGRFDARGFAPDANVKDVYFDFDRYDVRAADAKTLDANADYLKAHPTLLVIVEGHADERGTNEYNTALGERRAKAAVSYLASRGVQASRMSLVSYGEERPACAEHTDSCWAKNRRAHFLVKAQ
jgi:peptidoglycan-associated lipoprotein